MGTRRSFVQGAALAGGAALVADGVAIAQTVARSRYADKLTDAYYLKYEYRRGEYVNNLFNIVDWNNVAERFDAARA